MADCQPGFKWLLGGQGTVPIKGDTVHFASEPVEKISEDAMNLYEYFENTEGRGVLSTADADGAVNAAVYARPHVMEDGTFAIIMRDRLTHRNLQSNPHACYLFMEKGPDYRGKRLYLKKVREEQDAYLISELRRRQYIRENDHSEFLVFFEVTEELPLVGAGKGGQ